MISYVHRAERKNYVHNSSAVFETNGLPFQENQSPPVTEAMAQ